MSNHRDPIDVPGGQSSFRLDVSHSNSELNPPDGNGADFEPEGGMGAVVVHHTVTTLLIVMVVAIGTWAYLSFSRAQTSPIEGFSLQAPVFEVPAGDAQLQRFHFALDVFYTLYGKYPPDLEALIDEGLLSTTDLDYPPGSSTYIYQRVGDTYELGVERTLTTTEVAPSDEGPDAGASPEEPPEDTPPTPDEDPS